jgi:chemotaxis protein methyltransferase CheR
LPNEAAEDCRKAIAIAAFDPRPYFLLAQLAQERGDWAQAKTLLNKAIYLDPNFIAAYLELGGLHAQDGDNPRARRMYETVRAALTRLPAQTLIAPYKESTAADILAYVERLLAGPEGLAAGVVAAVPLSQSI